MRRKSFGNMHCPIARSLERVGEWWTILILRDALCGLTRFDQFEESLGNSFGIVPALVRPQSRGDLRLKTVGHDGRLEIRPNFLAEQADVDAMVASIELGLEIASQPAFRDLIKRRVAPAMRMSQGETLAFLRRSCMSYFHPVGTCAMGSGEEAVVDAELRVCGVRGLRIADASVMPTIPSANTNAPTIMIGEFASRLRIVAGRVGAVLEPAGPTHTPS